MFRRALVPPDEEDSNNLLKERAPLGGDARPPGPEGSPRMPKRPLLAISVPWFGLSMLADGLSALLLPYLLLVVIDPGIQATVLGLLTLLGLALGMLVQPLAGAVSDVISARRPLLLGGVGVALAGLALLGLRSSFGLAAVLIGYLVAVGGANVAQAGLQALIPDRVPVTWRGRAAGLKGLMDVGGAFVAFALLAVLLGGGDVSIALLALGAGLGLTVGAGLLTGATPGEVAEAPPSAVRASALWRGLGQSRAFASLLISRFCFLLGIYAVGRFLVLFIAHRLGLDAEATASEAGVVLAVLALLTAVASIPAGWITDRMGRRPMMIGGAVVAGVGIGLLPLAADTVQITLLGILLALGTAGFGAGSWALATDLVPRDEAARHMGLANYATAGAAAAAGFFGPIVDVGERIAPGLGFTLLMLLAATAVLAAGLVALRLPGGVNPRAALFSTASTQAKD